MEPDTREHPVPTDFRQSRDQAREYLIRHIRSDGGVGAEDRGLADYYRVAWALEVCGETRRVNRLCQCIRQYGVTPEGDFGPRPAETIGYSYAYYNAWVILCEHRPQQYDLYQRGMHFLMPLHDPVSGGFYSSATESSAETLQDL